MMQPSYASLRTNDRPEHLACLHMHLNGSFAPSSKCPTHTESNTGGKGEGEGQGEGEGAGAGEGGGGICRRARVAVDHKAGRGAAHEPTKPTRPDQPPFIPPFDNIQIHLLGQRISLLGPEIHLLGQNPTATAQPERQQ